MDIRASLLPLATRRDADDVEGAIIMRRGAIPLWSLGDAGDAIAIDALRKRKWRMCVVF